MEWTRNDGIVQDRFMGHFSARSLGHFSPGTLPRRKTERGERREAKGLVMQWLQSALDLCTRSTSISAANNMQSKFRWICARLDLELFCVVYALNHAQAERTPFLGCVFIARNMRDACMRAATLWADGPRTRGMCVWLSAEGAREMGRSRSVCVCVDLFLWAISETRRRIFVMHLILGYLAVCRSVAKWTWFREHIESNLNEMNSS